MALLAIAAIGRAFRFGRRNRCFEAGKTGDGSLLLVEISKAPNEKDSSILGSPTSPCSG